MTIPEAHLIVQKFLAERSLHRDPERIGVLFQEAFRTFYYEKTAAGPKVVTPESDRQFWMGIYAFIMEHLDARSEWSAEDVHRVCHELYDHFTGPEYYTLFDDVEPVLTLLRDAGYRLAVISNFAPTLQHILADKGIAHLFETMIVSTEVGLEKPDPAIFSLALERTGLQAEQVLYVGDHAANDVWAPNQIGMDAVRILRYDYQKDEGIRSLWELAERLGLERP